VISNLLGWICRLLVPAAAVALVEISTPLAASVRTFQVWQQGDIIQQGTVTDIVQTRDKYLWFGTYHGLVRYDGNPKRPTVYRSSNTPGLRNDKITSLCEDASGVLWIGHETGELTRLSRGTFEPEDLGLAWLGGSIEEILEENPTESGRDVWLRSNRGFIYRLRDHRVVHVPGDVTATRQPALAHARNGGLWMVSDGEVRKILNGRVTTILRGPLAPPGLSGAPTNEFFERVLPADDRGLFVVANNRLRKLVNGRWLRELGSLPPGRGVVSTLLETREGEVCVGTVKDGLYVFPPEAPEAPAQHYTRANGLSHDWVRSLCEDHEGNLWVGTGSGVDVLRPRKVTMLSPPDGCQGCRVQSFIVHSDGSAWVGTEGAGLYHFDGSNWARFSETNGLPNPYVWSVLETRSNDLLVGTWGAGLLCKAGSRFEARGDFARITAPVVSLFEAINGDLWVGTTKGLHRFESNRLAWSAGPDKLTLPDVRTITQTPDGAIWFGMSGGGLGCFARGKLKQYRKADGLSSDFILSLQPEPDGTLWYGSGDCGLGRVKDGKFARVGSNEGLLDDVISHVVDDGAGNFWMGSQRGILRVNRADLERCADRQEKKVHCLSYGDSEGLTSLCSGGFQPGACCADDGKLWFPTGKGLAIIDPATVSSKRAAPPVVIEELRVDRERLEIGSPENGRRLPGPLEVAAGKQDLEFRFTALSFTALSFTEPDKVLFKCWLQGREPSWDDPSSERIKSYSYLPPGTYTFHVTACNKDGVWNDEGAALSFKVLPYFWQTWWFLVITLTLGAGAVASGVLWTTRRRLRAKLEALEHQRAIERERARIARDIHDDLGASLTRITMLSQSVRGELGHDPQAAAEVDQIYGTARELTRAMDEIVWAVNPKHDTLDSLVTYLGRFAQNFLSAASLRCRLDVPLHLPAWALTAEVRHNVFLAFKEALHNVVKHAHASEVRLSLELQPSAFVLVVADNGRGFDPAAAPSRMAGSPDGVRVAGGNGRANMKKRLEEIGGSCEWVSAPQKGTRVRLGVPAGK
jgi:signal transduction histidine kinase/ligand-binding sensor domain-containing protein